jgi:CRISPR-associated protein Csh2
VSEYLTRRREFLFLYDIRMGNPNGDPDENRPRRLPDGTFYVTDVRLKRFVRDWLKTQDEGILVDRPEDAATNLTGRVQHFMNSKPEAIRAECEQYQKLQQASKEPAKAAGTKEAKPKKVRKTETVTEGELAGDDVTSQDDAEPASATGAGNDTTTGTGTKNSQAKAEAGRLVVSIILKSFIDARLFGSSLAFKDWDIEPRPKTLTGAVQINMGEVLHEAHEVDIAGTSTFASKEANLAGTFTTFFGLRYGLIGFNGIANEHSARLSHLTDVDYERFLEALWRSVSGAPTANTRSKMGQVPRVLFDIKYKAGSEFQFGCLLNYAKVVSNGKPEAAIASPSDYQLDLTRLVERLAHPAVETVRYAFHPDMKIEFAMPLESVELPSNWERWDLFGSLKVAKGA